MSFSEGVKAELCRENASRRCCALAECYGALLYCNTFSPREIKITTSSREFAERLPKLFRRAFSLAFDVIPEESRSGRFSFLITDTEKISRIFSAYGYDSQTTLSHHINLGVLENDCCKASFIRGAFLAGGSITDPAKRYHLEFVTSHASVSREIFSILLELGFSPRSTTRSGNYITYFKQSEAITDLFTTIGAPVAAMDIMNAKVEKDMRNSINRKVNCDSANADKIVSAAQAQLAAIRRIDRECGLEALPPHLYETALLRIANPEASLADLALLSDPPVTKSCLSHRLKKLMELDPSELLEK